jgi:hypothetical protein
MAGHDQAQPQMGVNKKNWEFLCYCRSCRRDQWGEGGPDPRRVVHVRKATVRLHFGADKQNRSRRPDDNHEEEERLVEEWKQMYNASDFMLQTRNGVAFACERPQVLGTRKRAGPEEGTAGSDSDSGSDSDDEPATTTVEELIEEGEVEEFVVEDGAVAGTEAPEAAPAPRAQGREEALDGLETFDDVRNLHPRLADLAPWHAMNVVEQAQVQLEGKASLSDIRKNTLLGTRTEVDREGFTLDRVFNRYKAEYKKRYSCPNGHDFGEEQGSACGKEGCNLGRTVMSLQTSLVGVLRHLLRQSVVADNIEFGPITLAKRMAEVNAQRGEGECTPPPNTMCSMWEAPATIKAMESFGGDGDVSPILCQLFIDGFQPFQSAYSMVVVMVKLLNLPPSIGNDHIVPICMVDGKSKPHFIDANVQEIVDELKSYIDSEGGDPPRILAVPVKDSSRHPRGKRGKRKLARFRPYLWQVNCDMKAMMMASHHREPNAKEQCNKCTSQSTRIEKPGRTSRQGPGHPVYPTVSASGDLLWTPKDDVEARVRMEWADDVAQRKPGLRGSLPNYVSRPVFADLPYFDVVWGFPVCSMHQVFNVVNRAYSQMQESAGWDSNTIRRWVQTPEGADWLQRSGMTIDEFRVDLVSNEVQEGRKKKAKKLTDPLVPSMLDCWPHVNHVVMPGERNVKVAYRTIHGIKPPSSYNGHPREPLHSSVQSKGASSYKKIKASGIKDHAACGALAATGHFGGVHDRVVRAYANLCYAIKKMCAHVINVEEIEELRDGGMTRILHELQTVLPPTEQTASLHALSHLPEQILRFGPLPDTWSFPFEAKFAELKPAAQLNKAMPVQTLACRTALQMGLRDLLRVLRHCDPTTAKDVAITSAVQTGNDGRLERKVLPLLRQVHCNEQGLDRQVANYRFRVTEFKTLKLYSVEIQGSRSARSKTDNRWVLIRRNTEAPTLGHVTSILRIEIFPAVSESGTVDDRVYLLVDESPLYACKWMDEAYEVEDKALERPQQVLVGLDQVVDQAFLGPHPDHPTRIRRDGEEWDSVPHQPKSYDRHLVYTKGRLRNIRIPADADFDRPDPA